MDNEEIHAWYIGVLIFLALIAVMAVTPGPDGFALTLSFILLGLTVGGWLFRITYLAGQRNKK